MWDYSLLTATRSIETSMPFVLYRLLVYLGVSLAYLFGALAGAGTLIAFASFVAKPSSVASFGAALGFCGCGYLMYKLRGGLLFNVKAGHLALLAEQSRNAKLPEGKAQIDFAKHAAAARFSPAVFTEAGVLVGQVAAELAASRWPFVRNLQNQALARVLAGLAAHVARAGNQAILALQFLSADDNPWKSARTGLVLLYRHFPELLKYQSISVLFEYLGLLAAFFVMLYPVDAVASSLPVNPGIWRYVFALVFAWSLKSAFFTPIATAAMAKLYFGLAQRDAAVTEAEIQALAQQSEVFRRIVSHAA